MFGLDAFGDDLHAERSGQREDRAHDRIRAAAAARGNQLGDERAVDLERLQRKLMQVRQRRVARAEIVERDRDAGGAKLLQRALDQRRIVEQHVLGHLDADALRRHVVRREEIEQASGEIGRMEMAAGEIDADEAAADGERRCDCADALEDQPVDLLADAAFLGDVEEVVRYQQAALRMAPAQQRFVADDLAVVEALDRLEERLEFLAHDRAAQIAFELEQIQRVAMQRLVEQREAMTALGLRAVHRDVGIAQEILGLAIARRGDCDADARRGEHFLVGEADRRVQHVDQALRGKRRVFVVLDVGEQHRELIAAEARDDIARLQAIGDAAADFLEQFIAEQMADRVVDDLEAVEIEEQHRKQTTRIAHVARQRARRGDRAAARDWAGPSANRAMSRA